MGGSDKSEATGGRQEIPVGFSDDALTDIFKKLRKWIDHGVATVKRRRPDVALNPPAISVAALNHAVREINTDLDFLATRRPRLRNSGISPGKTGGTLAFRLARHRIFHFDKTSCDDEAAQHLPENAVLQVVLEGLDIKWTAHPWIKKHLNESIDTDGPLGRRTHIDVVKEPSFLLRKRHCNQETLAIVLDTLCFMDSAVRDIETLETENAALKARLAALQD